MSPIPVWTAKPGHILIIFEEVWRERQRQDQLKAAGRFEKTCADDMPKYQKYWLESNP